MSNAQNVQQQYAMNNDNSDVTARDSIPSSASKPTAERINSGTNNTVGCKKSKMRSAHGAREASKRAQVAKTQKEGLSASDFVVNAAF